MDRPSNRRSAILCSTQCCLCPSGGLQKRTANPCGLHFHADEDPLEFWADLKAQNLIRAKRASVADGARGRELRRCLKSPDSREVGVNPSICEQLYLNNVVEQDHRRIKQRLRPMLGFKRFAAGVAAFGLTSSATDVDP